MTPKEKAIELFNKFWTVGEFGEDGLDTVLNKEEAQKCASIAADEVLIALGNEVIFVFTDFNWVLYWEQVKKEIEAL